MLLGGTQSTLSCEEGNVIQKRDDGFYKSSLSRPPLCATADVDFLFLQTENFSPVSSLFLSPTAVEMRWYSLHHVAIHLLLLSTRRHLLSIQPNYDDCNCFRPWLCKVRSAIEHSSSWKANSYLASQKISQPEVITMFAKACHCFISWARWIQFASSYPFFKCWFWCRLTDWLTTFVLTHYIFLVS
jgi:hypothetical protein